MQDRTKRLSAAYDYLRSKGKIHTQNDVASAMGANKTNVSYAFNGNSKYLTDKFLVRFNGAFGDVFNADWLLTGEGKMLKDGAGEVQGAEILTGKVIPLYDVEAAAGLGYGMDMTPTTRPSNMIEIGALLKDSESALRVYGNSMVPNYPAGCVVGLKLHTDSFIVPGHVYVVETRDNRYLKRVYTNVDKTALRCISDNHIKHSSGPAAGEYCYPEFEIPLNEVVRIHRVTGVIKRNIL